MQLATYQPSNYVIIVEAKPDKVYSLCTIYRITVKTASEMRLIPSYQALRHCNENSGIQNSWNIVISICDIRMSTPVIIGVILAILQGWYGLLEHGGVITHCKKMNITCFVHSKYRSNISGHFTR